jgi:uncharacterized protein (TIGR02145 family)
MIKIIVCISFIGSMMIESLVAQINFGTIQSNTEKNVLLQLNNQQRDSIKYPEEGLMILNTETNCVNYFSQKKWYTLCGQCTPQPPVPVIDSVRQKGDRIWVYFNNSQTKADSFKVNILPMNWSFVVYQSPFSIQLRLPETKLSFQMLAYNICGMGSLNPAVEYVFHPQDPCGGQTMLVDNRNNQKYLLVPLFNQCWIKGELKMDLSKTKDFQKEENNYFYAWQGQLENSKNICPTGFRLPNKNDLNILAESIDEPFNNYTVKESVSMSLKEFEADFSGARDEAGKPFFVGITDYFWLNAAYENQQGIGMVSNSGIQMGAAPTSSFIPVRCIRDESK